MLRKCPQVETYLFSVLALVHVKKPEANDQLHQVRTQLAQLLRSRRSIKLVLVIENELSLYRNSHVVQQRMTDDMFLHLLWLNCKPGLH